MPSKFAFAVLALALAAHALAAPSIATPAASQSLELDSLNPVNTRAWIDATAILEQIQKILQDIQNKIQVVGEQVEQAIENALDAAENAAREVADRWATAVNDMLENANNLGVSVEECRKNAASLQEVSEELGNATQKCVLDGSFRVNETYGHINALLPRAEQTLTDAAQVIQDCTALGWLSGPFCLSTRLPYVAISAARLATDAGLLSAKALGQIATLPAANSLCIAGATAGASASASAIITSISQCVNDRMNPAG